MKKKIAYVINSIRKNGPSNVVLNLINEIDKNKYDIYLITIFNEDDVNIIEELSKQGINVKQYKLKSRLLSIFFMRNKLLRYVRKCKIDITHSHGFIPDIICSQLKYEDILMITTIHNNMYEDYTKEYGNVRGKLFIYIHLYFLKKLNYCICCSESVLDSMKNYLNNAYYIRNGIGKVIPCRKQVSREFLNIGEKDILYVFVGKLDVRKNIIYLIEQFVKYHNSNEYLLVLGSGIEYENCIKISDDHVKMLGFVKNVNEYLSIANIYVSASKSEGMSISILEAMDLGMGLFLSNIPSHKEIFSVESDIYIGELFDEYNFKESLETLRKNKYKLNKNAIKGLKERKFSAECMASLYQKFYDSEV